MVNGSRSALILTRAFPPEATVAVHRVVGLCRHLVESGRWRVTVLTAAPPAGAAVDEGLLDEVPESVRVVRAAAPELPLLASRAVKGWRWPATEPAAPDGQAEPCADDSRSPDRLRRLVDWASWWLQVPDTQTGWLVPAVWAGLREARRQRPDVIFSTAPLWTAHVAGAALSALLRVPLVADFRDPWTGSTFRPVPYAAHRWLNGWLERRVVARAAHVTCAWDGIRRYMAGRYPKHARKMTTILNGYDRAALETVSPERLDVPGRLFVHAGGFYGPRSPIPLFEAVGRLRSAHPASPPEAAFALVGADHYQGRALTELAAQHGAADWVRIVPRRTHREAIALIKGADAAMLFGQSGSDELASIPAKAYEYIGLGKPVLAIGAGREVCDVMRRGGCPVWPAPAGDPAALAAAIEQMLRFLAGGERPPIEPGSERDCLTRARMAEEMEKLLVAGW